jgi:general secretion pathway protein L
MAIFWGIDIGTSSVKVAVVKTAYRKIFLVGLASVDIAPMPTARGALPSRPSHPPSMRPSQRPSAGRIPLDDSAIISSDGRPSQPPRSSVAPPTVVEIDSPVHDAIRQAVQQAYTGRGGLDSVAIGLPGIRAALRVLKLPAGVQKQIGEVLPFELEAQVPFEVTESVFDYRPLVHAPGKSEGTIDVLCAVALTSHVRDRIELVKASLNAEPERVMVAGLPLAQLVPFVPEFEEEGPLCVLDIGTTTSELLIFHGGEPVFSRTLASGTEGLPATAARLAREARISIGAFRSLGGEPPKALYLCGGGAFMTGAEPYLAAELQIPVSMLPAIQLEQEGSFAERMAEMPKFAKAIGLALGATSRLPSLNLRRGPLAYERGFGWIKERAPIVAGLTAVILVSFLFASIAKVYAVSKDQERYEAALGIVTKEVLGEETNSAERAAELLAQQGAGADDDPMPHGDAFDVMMRLADAVPQSMVHDVEDLDVQKGHVTIKGVVAAVSDAEAIKGALAAERCFSDVKLVSTHAGVNGRQKYHLEFDIKCPEDQKGAKKKDSTGAAAPAASAPAGGK